MRAGFASFAGKPNVGKSSIINAIMRKKVVIVSDKPQTTRNSINVIYNDPESQIIFIDTPGLHKPLHRLGEYMVRIAVQALKNVDVVLLVFDAKTGITEADEFTLQHVGKSEAKTIGVINKIDLATSEDVERLERFVEGRLRNLVGVVRTSAVRGDGLEELLALTKAHLPESPRLYPDDSVTDRPVSFIVSELIREKIFHFTYEEVPHSSAVIVEEMVDRPNGMVYIRATIYVERESQKGILIGKQGQMIKRIGESARRDVEYLLERRVFLDLHVKVKRDWRNKDFIILNEIGMRDELE